ncbi:MAG: hypothetical protein HDR32_08640 [Treponema sp.]|nr:hypothetical protein [Treponema sp.]
MSISEIRLFRERPEDSVECESGIIRIEQVVLVDEDGNETEDQKASYLYKYHEEDDNSFSNMLDEIAKHYGVDKSIIDYNPDI